MKDRAEAIIIDEKDNVAVALETMPIGTMVSIGVEGRAERIRLVSEIPKGHKFALKDLARGAAIVKYGEVIGKSTVPIARGEHVHVHNVTSQPRGGSR
jgi:altronate dehydratase small subunit